MDYIFVCHIIQRNLVIIGINPVIIYDCMISEKLRIIYYVKIRMLQKEIHLKLTVDLFRLMYY